MSSMSFLLSLAMCGCVLGVGRTYTEATRYAFVRGSSHFGVYWHDFILVGFVMKSFNYSWIRSITTLCHSFVFVSLGCP